MSWKNWPAWLKGGIIGGGIAILFGISLFFALSLNLDSCPVNKCSGLTKIAYNIVKILAYPVYNQCIFITQCSEVGCLICLILGPLILFIELFLIGAIIGFIIQKIKSRKEKQK